MWTVRRSARSSFVCFGVRGTVAAAWGRCVSAVQGNSVHTGMRTAGAAAALHCTGSAARSRRHVYTAYRHHKTEQYIHISIRETKRRKEKHGDPMRENRMGKIELEEKMGKKTKEKRKQIYLEEWQQQQQPPADSLVQSVGRSGSHMARKMKSTRTRRRRRSRILTARVRSRRRAERARETEREEPQ